MNKMENTRPTYSPIKNQKDTFEDLLPVDKDRQAKKANPHKQDLFYAFPFFDGRLEELLEVLLPTNNSQENSKEKAWILEVGKRLTQLGISIPVLRQLETAINPDQLKLLASRQQAEVLTGLVSVFDGGLDNRNSPYLIEDLVTQLKENPDKDLPWGFPNGSSPEADAARAELAKTFPVGIDDYLDGITVLSDEQFMPAEEQEKIRFLYPLREYRGQ